ncbi:hypothetical protein Fmac_023778 [Flemingia macrophylla]|uniref:Transposase n=1 Tax=Flemingia macrophylla TaxID=520843 RepID=A0ABD1LMH4_9FABA
MLTRIPCYHVISCMKYMNLDPKEYIPQCFRKTAYELVYAPIIYLLNGPSLWHRTGYTDVLPPPARKMPGRPKKRRNLEAWELRKDDTQLRKACIPKKCSRCQQLNHNKVTCKMDPTSQTSHPQSTEQSQPEINQQIPSQQSQSQRRQPPPISHIHLNLNQLKNNKVSHIMGNKVSHCHNQHLSNLNHLSQPTSGISYNQEKE